MHSQCCMPDRCWWCARLHNGLYFSTHSVLRFCTTANGSAPRAKSSWGIWQKGWSWGWCISADCGRQDLALHALVVTAHQAGRQGKPWPVQALWLIGELAGRWCRQLPRPQPHGRERPAAGPSQPSGAAGRIAWTCTAPKRCPQPPACSGLWHARARSCLLGCKGINEGICYTLSAQCWACRGMPPTCTQRLHIL